MIEEKPKVKKKLVGKTLGRFRKNISKDSMSVILDRH